MFAAGGEDQISWASHIGGIIAGAILVLVLRSRGVPLFAGADEDATVAPADQPAVAAEPLTPDPPAAPPRWGRGNASSSD